MGPPPQVAGGRGDLTDVEHSVVLVLLVVKGRWASQGPKASGKVSWRGVSQNTLGEEEREEPTRHTGTCTGPEAGSSVWVLEGI